MCEYVFYTQGKNFRLEFSEQKNNTIFFTNVSSARTNPTLNIRRI